MITSVRLQNFRSYTDATFEFSDGVNAIVGPNGIGKTNILEAIYTTLTGSSWRVKDELLIKNGEDWARVDIRTKEHTYTLKLDNRINVLKKTRYIDDKESRDNFMPVVLFEPDFIRVLTDGPGLRRSWIDGVISQLKPGYNQVVAGYSRALSQRNALLKRNQIESHHIFVWNLKLTEYGAQIANEREEIVAKINENLESEYQKISDADERVQATYTPTFGTDYAGEMLKALQRNLPRDSQLGFTTVGPHREDVEFTLRNKPLIETASRGEVRSVAASLIKVHNTTIKNNILLLDDIVSEFDEKKIKRFIDFYINEQIIETKTSSEGNESNVIQIEN